eukprot:CAMPEP_0185286078 /NCGR_PEP_ID=MMETSP1363-20130426/2068_1 /TAXON_ID=38817 /ORGANISM="Gephyrocapsa oceanica, Strain RCC1303" /LENGTH=149 /DNA_ID=CAMNT_0027881873 /DNA_START=99 /DNA_END=549 /DNA_ORIENTATION=+
MSRAIAAETIGFSNLDRAAQTLAERIAHAAEITIACVDLWQTKVAAAHLQACGVQAVRAKAAAKAAANSVGQRSVGQRGVGEGGVGQRPARQHVKGATREEVVGRDARRVVHARREERRLEHRHVQLRRGEDCGGGGDASSSADSEGGA